MTRLPNKGSNGDVPSARAKSREREERLALELRRNLLKRKEQMRARDAEGTVGDDTDH